MVLLSAGQLAFLAAVLLSAGLPAEVRGSPGVFPAGLLEFLAAVLLPAAWVVLCAEALLSAGLLARPAGGLFRLRL